MSFALASLAVVTLSPAAVLLWTVVLPKPELSILAIGSAFVWLLAIVVCAALWWATAALEVLPRLAVTVALGVVVQEASRGLTYILYTRLLRGLQSVGLQPTRGNLSALHRMAPAAVANGVGIGVVQTVVMYGDMSGRALQPGSLYTEACESLSLFAVDALCSLGMLLLNVLLSIMGWTCAYPQRSRKWIGSIVGLHLLASASTLLNSAEVYPTNGCAVALPCLFGSVGLAGLLTLCAVAGSLRSCSASLETVGSRP